MHEVIIYPDNSSYVIMDDRGRYRYVEDTKPLIGQFKVPIEREYDWPALYFRLTNGKMLRLVVFGNKPLYLRTSIVK